MKYVNETIRRQDRRMDEKDAIKLLSDGEYGVLSMYSEEKGCYGIPVSYVWDGKDSIYIHSATEGEKFDYLSNNPNVSFCVVGNTHLLPNRFTTEYESIILKGTAKLHLSDEEKMEALHIIMGKFSPNDKVVGEKYAMNSFHRVEIIRVDFTEWSGKCLHVKANTLGD